MVVYPQKLPPSILTKELKTLPDDIDALFTHGKVVDEANLKELLENIGNILRERLAKNLNSVDVPKNLRMSKIGLPDRKLWFEFNTDIEERPAKNALKFIYGDIIEQLILFFAKETGHTVEDEQKKVTINGIDGHQDAKIDGITTDIKSASSYAFKKFKTGTLMTNDDPFGYVGQLSGYMYANNTDKGAFLAVNKENGEITILPLESIDLIHAPSRIDHLKHMITLPEPPEKKCYEPKDYGTSGNKVLDKNCNYCPFKTKCWKDTNNGQGLRAFDYASGTVYFTDVVNTPRVQEITLNDTNSQEDAE